ncbi:ABC transporter permease subunit [Neorhizobium galegae]|uniref:ABC transporter permease subunit n=1 Tax=Neorhizobium galegae TaxID=399 RepID=UPI00349EAD9D
MVTPGEGCPGHSMSPYLSQNTKNLIAALHSTPRPAAILEQTLKRWQHSVFVILPLATRAALPSAMNTIVATVKNSAYLQAIGLVELTFVAVDRIAYDFRAIEMFASICVIYLLCVFTISGLGYVVERRLSRPFGGR